MKDYSSWLVHLVTFLYIAISLAQSVAPTEATVSLMDGKDPLTRSSCNFSQIEDIIGPKFIGNDDNDNICYVMVEAKPITFSYACDGVSHPWNCPQSVIYQGYTVEIISLFHQVTLRRTSPVNMPTIRMSTVLLSQSKETILIHCTCEAYDGQSYKMVISSGMKNTIAPWILVALVTLQSVLNIL